MNELLKSIENYLKDVENKVCENDKKIIYDIKSYKQIIKNLTRLPLKYIEITKIESNRIHYTNLKYNVSNNYMELPQGIWARMIEINERGY